MTSTRRSAIINLSSTPLHPRKLTFAMTHIRVNGDSFFTGGKDGKIFQVDLMGNPLNMFEGHESAVNSLSQCVTDELVSGSWDG
jgi:WD40 repeat protein